ncbi:MAG: FGGY-family carbohydrate kinase, partial [Paracoccaceae bacterium]
EHAPATSAAHGATSGAAKVLMFQALTPSAHLIVHQADWITGQLCGVFASDDNNALKTGYDSITQCWPDWMEEAGIDRNILPTVQEPGSIIGHVLPAVAAEYGVPPNVQFVSGTTDGCAAFLATGASQPGDGVTSIGTTLILKILSEKPIFDPTSGIYSHRLLGNWLAGGASNSGGGVLLKYFSPDEIAELSSQIDPTILLNLGYYPLSQPGERFPIADPELQPKVSPRPDNDVDFLQALFEGIASVETLGYSKLSDLGAPALKSVRTVGGAAKNDALTELRLSLLGVSGRPAAHVEAAYGSALLAKYGIEKSNHEA